MSEELAISLRGVSKCFKRYDRPVDRLKELLIPGKSRALEFWALRDIDLDVPKGQTLGIVGRNGSGKSTLLQIIAGTLTPTTGTVQVNGRVSALLELGSGFNPEFTGRQNVFFNGQLLGLTKEEVEERFDEIAAFADIGDFIDQPVKTYSSGMFVRLAFAVAVHADPEILIVDEALSVGDEVFQKKCCNKIFKFQDAGITTIFVSHSAATVTELCETATLLDHGSKLIESTSNIVIKFYQKLSYAPKDQKQKIINEIKYFQNNTQSLHELSSLAISEIESSSFINASTTELLDEFDDPYLKIKDSIEYESIGARIDLESVYIKNTKGRVVNNLTHGKEYVFSFVVYFQMHAYSVRFGTLVKTINGVELGGIVTHPLDGEGVKFIPESSVVRINLPFQANLHPGTYFMNAGVSGLIDGERMHLHRILDAKIFRINPISSIYTTGYVNLSAQTKPSIQFENSD